MTAVTRRTLTLTATIWLTVGLGPAGAVATAAAAQPDPAVQILLPANAGPDSASYLIAVDCLRPGWCAAGGAYYTRAGNEQAMVVAQSGGHWARARELGLPANAERNPFGEVNSVDCTGPGSCVAVGDYNGDTRFQGFVATQSGGAWGRARESALPANSAARSDFQLTAVTCTGLGSCVAAGDYKDRAGHYQALAVTESRGRWAPAVELAMPAGARSDPQAFATSVACPRPGACVIAGQYTDTSGAGQAVVVTSSDGRWRRGTKITPPLGAGADPFASLSSAACAAAGSCVVVGGYDDHATGSGPMAATQAGDRWGRARSVSVVPADAAAAPHAFLLSVACPVRSSCIAVGGYVNRFAGYGSMAAVEIGGRWIRARQVLPPGNAVSGAGHYSVARSVSCAGSGACAVVGQYLDAAGDIKAMATTTPAP